MKVSQVRETIKATIEVKATIELESEKELKCLDYLLFCNVDPTDNSIRQGKLSSINLDYNDVHNFQHDLARLLEEGDC